MGLQRTVLAVVLAVLAVPSPSAASTGAPVVRVAEGALRGSVEAGVATFRGVPYAAPPVGDLRWRSPRPSHRWTGVRPADEPGPRCPQRGPAGSEDCLHLEVQAPWRSRGRVPVVVFVHGGGFVGGTGADHDASRLVRQGGVVAVTVNYRLGALGFLDHPDDTDPAAGNYGLADQRAALRWVRRNIAAFGGDPGAVTLWGQSAGAVSVCAQVAAPGSRGLFHRAIVQSGPCGNPLPDRPTARDRGTAFAATLGAYHTSDLRYLLDSRDDGAYAPPPLTDAERPLADTMVRHWASFIRTGHPAAGWPRHDGRRTLSFTAAGTAVIDAGAAHGCGFWSTRRPV